MVDFSYDSTWWMRSLKRAWLQQSISISILDCLMQSVLVHVSSGVQRHNTRNPACSSARNAVIHANVYLQGPMPTRKNAHATITGRPREEAQNALRAFFCYSFPISS
ncbi:uncharacterized protein A4U43_C02F12470 [Asparagus officinalis]|uniref:Uncharacterized protein n=1 Tax=Asparagus officinalis TaxID=4686 RepID=A0A5P1FIM5_ASPOF|nr:uncharacterized protein A4U43_C02F12470 [Asparagus officinalis]